MSTFAERIVQHAAERPDDPAVTCADESLTFAQLADQASRYAAHLAAAGAGHGSIVVLCLPNGVDLMAGAVASWWIGATPCPVSPKLADGERIGLIDLAAADAVVVADPALAPGHEVLTPADMSAPIDTAAPDPDPAPRWKAIGSGGSTGRPKLIVAEQPASTEDVMPLAALLRIPRQGRMVVPGPLSHNAPFAAACVGLLSGSHVVLLPRFDASETLRLVEEHGAQWLYQVPTMMLRIWRLPDEERNGRDISSLEVVFHMAAPCPPWLKEAWCEWVGPDTVLELYGGTELQAMTIVTGAEWLQHKGTVGRVMLGEMEVRGEDGTPLPAGEAGEVWMRRGPDEVSPYSYMGATARTAADGWESLGDHGHFDADGYLHLGDRTTDMILVGGSNVYPAEVEAVLDAHPAVRSSCVIGLPDDDLGNVPHGIVELAEDVPDEELLTWARDRLAGYKAPRTIEKVDEPLRDDAGKVRRAQLRAARLPQGGTAL